MIPHMDYQHVDDYDPEDAHWMDMTRIGSSYREEVDVSKPDHYRHREPHKLTPWKRGLAPKILKRDLVEPQLLLPGE